jgi:hypothetical protein
VGSRTLIPRDQRTPLPFQKLLRKFTFLPLPLDCECAKYCSIVL